uniref:Phosphatidylinositol-glycan biosynthesis class F protein n=1 Tax=Trichuris muris TaxID=70415 RepID=A0A5S6R4A5_TRIMR
MAVTFAFLFDLFTSTIVYHVVIVLFGAPIFSQLLETYSLAVLLTVFTTLPCLLTFNDYERFREVFFHVNIASKAERYAFCATLGSLLGAWLGAFPIPLDWDRPWQRWPTTCVVGACLGFCLGIAIAAVLNLRCLQVSRQPRKFV